MAEVKDTKKSKKPKDNNSKTVLEVNEITEESLRAEELKKIEEQKKQKEIEDRIKKEKLEKTLNKIFKGYNINRIARVLMWIFIALVSIYIYFIPIKQSFSSPILKVFIKEESLKEVSSYKLDKVNNININLDTFDVNVKESETDDIIIRYNKKYDKKINIQNKNKSLNIEEKKKIFKPVKFDSKNNAMIIEIPRTYEGSLEIESKSGIVKLDQYKRLIEKEEKKDNTQEDFYKNFFNI